MADCPTFGHYDETDKRCRTCRQQSACVRQTYGVATAKNHKEKQHGCADFGTYDEESFRCRHCRGERKLCIEATERERRDQEQRRRDLQEAQAREKKQMRQHEAIVKRRLADEYGHLNQESMRTFGKLFSELVAADRQKVRPSCCGREFPRTDTRIEQLVADYEAECELKNTTWAVPLPAGLPSKIYFCHRLCYWRETCKQETERQEDDFPREKES
jgi:hypothetical protein